MLASIASSFSLKWGSVVSGVGTLAVGEVIAVLMSADGPFVLWKVEEEADRVGKASPRGGSRGE
jgi:hypothetical protein